QGTLLMARSTVEGNAALGSGAQGGGIASESGTLNLNNCIIRNNQASAGGGIYLLNGNLTAINTTLSGNTALTGGGLFLRDGNASVDLLNCTVSGNRATALSLQGGGGIYADVGSGLLLLNLNSCTIADNVADGGGGGGLLLYGLPDSESSV